MFQMLNKLKRAKQLPLNNNIDLKMMKAIVIMVAFVQVHIFFLIRCLKTDRTCLVYVSQNVIQL